MALTSAIVTNNSFEEDTTAYHPFSPRISSRPPTAPFTNTTTTTTITNTALSSSSSLSKDQFVRTKLCPHFSATENCRKGSRCFFAHGEHQLVVKPDLRKTKLCQHFVKFGTCSNGSSCIYAHSEKELRCTSSYWKTDLCRYWKLGGCSSGAYCRHAHGTEELRPKTSINLINQDTPNNKNTQADNTINTNSYYNGSHRCCNINIRVTRHMNEHNRNHDANRISRITSGNWRQNRSTSIDGDGRNGSSSGSIQIGDDDKYGQMRCCNNASKNSKICTYRRESEIGIQGYVCSLPSDCSLFNSSSSSLSKTDTTTTRGGISSSVSEIDEDEVATSAVSTTSAIQSITTDVIINTANAANTNSYWPSAPPLEDEAQCLNMHIIPRSCSQSPSSSSIASDIEDMCNRTNTSSPIHNGNNNDKINEDDIDDNGTNASTSFEISSSISSLDNQISIHYGDAHTTPPSVGPGPLSSSPPSPSTDTRYKTTGLKKTTKWASKLPFIPPPPNSCVPPPPPPDSPSIPPPPSCPPPPLSSLKKSKHLTTPPRTLARTLSTPYQSTRSSISAPQSPITIHIPPPPPPSDVKSNCKIRIPPPPPLSSSSSNNQCTNNTHCLMYSALGSTSPFPPPLSPPHNHNDHDTFNNCKESPSLPLPFLRFRSLKESSSAAVNRSCAKSDIKRVDISWADSSVDVGNCGVEAAVRRWPNANLLMSPLLSPDSKLTVESGVPYGLQYKFSAISQKDLELSMRRIGYVE